MRHSPLSRSAFLVLLALSDRPRHGLAVVERIEETTQGRIRMGPGTLYGTLHKLEASGLIRETKDAPDPDDHDARRRYYLITPRGKRVLDAEVDGLRVLASSAAASRAGSDA